MTDRDRLVEMLRGTGTWHTVEQIADALLAAGVTLPPQPAGPVTLTFVVGDLYQGLCEPWDTRLVALGFARGQQVRVTIEDAATQSTLLTPAEVERRAREWADSWGYSGAVKINLVEALTNKDERNGNV